MLYSEEKPEKNIENMLLLLQTSEKETFLKKTLHRNEIIKGRVGFESSFCHYFEEVSLIVEIEMKYEGLFGLFDHLSVNFNEKEYNKRIEVNEMRKEGNLLKKKVPLKLIRKITGEERLYIVSIELIGEKKHIYLCFFTF